ncbi:hypothetical protein CMUS01_04755 [Colletotrichum musicola]|uniref:Uncharacterized protein n=1 Tax=Colletotrichum musicola TaxID=2175873 RepID=A0A8H6KUW7_9PEZI|nr:hypothetical protein CMUS01_04755 [Colletotrichum musicola]
MMTLQKQLHCDHQWPGSAPADLCHGTESPACPTQPHRIGLGSCGDPNTPRKLNRRSATTKPDSRRPIPRPDHAPRSPAPTRAMHNTD